MKLRILLFALFVSQISCDEVKIPSGTLFSSHCPPVLSEYVAYPYGVFNDFNNSKNRPIAMLFSLNPIENFINPSQCNSTAPIVHKYYVTSEYIDDNTVTLQGYPICADDHDELFGQDDGLINLFSQNELNISMFTGSSIQTVYNLTEYFKENGSGSGLIYLNQSNIYYKNKYYKTLQINSKNPSIASSAFPSTSTVYLNSGVPAFSQGLPCPPDWHLELVDEIIDHIVEHNGYQSRQQISAELMDNTLLAIENLYKDIVE